MSKNKSYKYDNCRNITYCMQSEKKKWPETLLGWRTSNVKQEDISKTLKTGVNYSIAELRNGEKIYAIEDFPELSDSEAKLVAEVVDAFIADEKTRTLSSMAEVLEIFCMENNLNLDEDQRKYVLYIIKMLVSGFGFISSILSNDNIEEVAIIGLGKQKPVYTYEKNFGWLRTNAFFTDEKTVKNLVNKMSQQLGRHITFHNPRMNAVLPDGSRLSAAFPPICFEPIVTLRKFREKPFTPAELVLNNTISSESMAFLWMAMQTDCSVLIAGNTGSGKTTLLNALFSFVPENERIVITEETPEISIPHKHVAKVHVVENLNIRMSNLIVDTLRMRPDRIIIGEIRNEEEVSAFMDTLLAGQGRGSYATFHSNNASEALARLRKLGVPELDLSAIDLIIVQKRQNRISLHSRNFEERRTTQICEVLQKGEKAGLNELFGFSFESRKLLRKNESLKLSEKIRNSFGISDAEMKKELERRQKWLEGRANFPDTLERFFGEANEQRDIP